MGRDFRVGRLQHGFSSVFSEGDDRVAGTLAGYFVGLICASVTEGEPIWQALALFLIGAIGMSMRFRSQVFLCVDYRIGYRVHTRGS